MAWRATQLVSARLTCIPCLLPPFASFFSANLDCRFHLTRQPAMIDELLRWLWSSLLDMLGIGRTTHAASDAREGWTVDRPLGNTEKYWLFTPLQRMYCLTAAVGPTGRSRLTKERLSSAVLHLIQTPGFFNLVCTLSQPHSESAARWLAPINVDVVRRLVECSITVVGDESINDVIERELATDFDVSDATVALWRLVVLPASGSIVWTFQHILCDGIAARNSMQLLLQQLSEAGSGEYDEPFVRPPLVGAVETLLPPALTVSSWITVVRKLLSSKPAAFTGRVTDELPRSTMSTRVHFEQLTTSQTIRAREKARVRGVTMHELIVAASASTLRLVFQPGTAPCSFLTPVNLRPWMPRDYHRSVGNLFTAYKDIHRCSDDDEAAWQFSRRYMAGLKQSVLHEYRTQTILSWLGVRLGMATALAGDVAKLHNLRNGTVEVSNLGAVDAVPHCTSLSFTSRAHNDGPLLLLGPVSANGSLSLSLSYCAPLVSKEEAQRFVQEMIRFMTE